MKSSNSSLSRRDLERGKRDCFDALLGTESARDEEDLFDFTDDLLELVRREEGLSGWADAAREGDLRLREVGLSAAGGV